MKIQTEIKLDSAHKLPNYIGKCSNLHGHSFRVIISIECSVRDKNEFVLDFVKIKEVMNKYDHCFLNDYFENPTAENLAKAFAYEIKKLGEYEVETWDISTNSKIRDGKILSNRFNLVTVKVFESDVSWAEESV